MIYTSSGDYLHTFTTTNGCDSLVILSLTINNSTVDTFSITACDSIAYDSMMYYSSGDYLHTFTTSNGCDSLVVFSLTINNSTTDTLSIVACDSFAYNSILYTSSGDYLQTFTNTNGCDSLVILSLIINNSTVDTFSITACDSIAYDSMMYYSSGDYLHTFITTNGCDSLVVLSLIIYHSNVDTLSITACDSFAYNSILYTSSGDYLHTFTTTNGCDSLVILSLTINNSTTDTLSITACDSFGYDSMIYTSSGDYLHTFTTTNGCDSLVILSLTINNSTVDTFSITACDSFAYNSMMYYSSGDYLHTYTTSNGCDSLVILSLTINNSTFDTLSITACDSFAYDSIVYTNSGEYLHTFTNAEGCDSLVRLILEIPHLSGSAGSDQVICSGATTQMNATLPSNASGIWSLISGTAVINSITSANTNISGITAGSTNYLEWKVTNQNCVKRDTVEVQKTDIPFGLSIDSIGIDWVTFSWSAVINPDSFWIRLTENCTSSGGNKFIVAGNIRSFTITGLKGCTNYCIKVRTQCEGPFYSSFSSVLNFTSGGPVPCVAAKGFTITHTHNCAYNVNWKKTCVSADSFRVQYKLSNSTIWTPSTWTTGTNKNIQLSSGTWNVRVQSKCGSTIYTTAATTYSVSSCRMAAETQEIESYVTLFPNPASKYTILNFSTQNEGDYSILLRDIAGRVVKTVSGRAGVGENTAVINVEELSSGIYFILFTFEGGTIPLKLTVE